jgi:uncharacterized membrane protein
MNEVFTVDTSSLNLRSAPVIDSSNILAMLPSGQAVTRLAVDSDNWWKVSTVVGGQTIVGFLSQRFLKLMEVEYKVIADSLNLRSAPVVDASNLITAIPKGQIVKKLEVASDDDWWKISTTVASKVIEGYVASRFLAPLNDPFGGKKVVGMDNTSQSFRNRVVQISSLLQTKPIFLMAVMSFETGGTFSASKRNPVSGATGLIQFIAPTAHSLGTSLDALAKMTALDQLDFVEKYLRPFTGRLLTIEDAYMAVLFPVAIGKGRQFVLFSSPSSEYTQNRGLDLNNNGRVTVAEAATLVASRII